MPIATFTVKNQLGNPVQAVKLFVLDSLNAVVDSGLTDVDGELQLTLTVGNYRVVAQKNGAACGNSRPVAVV